MKKEILNLTQHVATVEQTQQGVVEPMDKKAVQTLLTFVGMPTVQEVQQRAKELAQIVVESGYQYAMIGGAPYLMAPLHNSLVQNGIIPLYAFSERVSIESVNKNGETVKTTVFKHKGFI